MLSFSIRHNKSFWGFIVALTLCFRASGAVESEQETTTTETCAGSNETEYVVKQIEIENKPIFDESAEDAIALHRWANALHIITKPVIIRDRLTFDEGDQVSEEDIVEAEAILRARRYLANAEISTTKDCQQGTVDVHVETYDNWSLIPTLSFSRSGGQNNTLIGVREDNLLGLGIRATARYTEDEQRTGYQLGFSSIVPWVRHANVFLRIEDNDDGEVYSFVFDKPFYHLNTPTSTFVRATSVTRVSDIFQNDLTRNSFELDAEEFTAAYGWSLTSSNQFTKRLTLGVTYDKADFALANISPSTDLSLVPESRDFLYPWVSYQYAERKIVVMEDIFLINQPEDINLGWQFTSRLGIEVENDSDGLGVHSSLGVTKGLAWGNNQLFVMSARFNAITNAGIEDLTRFDARFEYFNRQSELIGYYTRLDSTLSSGQFLDRPIVIDDENGVRGFPRQYQHGDHRISASAEVRFYTNYNIYQLFEVGFAAFADTGRAFSGDQALLNEDPNWLSSVGIGARLFSNKASNSGVVHIDIAKPISDGENIDSLEVSVQLRRSF